MKTFDIRLLSITLIRTAVIVVTVFGCNDGTQPEMQSPAADADADFSKGASVIYVTGKVSDVAEIGHVYIRLYRDLRTGMIFVRPLLAGDQRDIRHETVYYEKYNSRISQLDKKSQRCNPHYRPVVPSVADFLAALASLRLSEDGMKRKVPFELRMVSVVRQGDNYVVIRSRTDPGPQVVECANCTVRVIRLKKHPQLTIVSVGRQHAFVFDQNGFAIAQVMVSNSEDIGH